MLILLPVSYAEELNFEFDANGNLVTGDGYYRIYDGLNHLHQIKAGDNASAPLLYEFTWEPLEEKIFIKDEFYPNGSLKSSTYYFGDDYVHIKNESGDFSEVYVYADGQLVGYINTDGQKRYVLSDHLGSSVVVLDEQGNVVEETFYSPFGEIIEIWVLVGNKTACVCSSTTPVCDKPYFA